MSNGTLINNNNLNDNQKKNGMFNFLKTETITTNKQPGNINIYSSINSNWEGGTSGQTADLRDKRVYKSNFRQPIQAVRKETNCNDNEQCQKVTKLYKDHYSQNDNNTLGSDCPNPNGSLPTGRLNNINLDGSITKSQSGITTRTSKPLIRSGMQPNTAGQQNSGLSHYETVGGGVVKKRQTYSYSFRELLNNRRKSTAEKSLEYVTKEGYDAAKSAAKAVGEADDAERKAAIAKQKIKRYGYGGSCSSDTNCSYGKVTHRLNNAKFHKQGSVDSSSRLERLKLETIRGQYNCTNDIDCSERHSRRIFPFIRAIMGPPVDISNAKTLTNQRKYKGLFNANHTEVNYPQISALARVRGSVSNKTTMLPNSGVCCNGGIQKLTQ
jgi:hypothetical protein